MVTAMDEEAVLDAIGDLYEAAVESGGWPQVLNGIRRLLDGSAHAQFRGNKQTGEGPVTQVADYTTEVCDTYMARYGNIEPGADLCKNTPLSTVDEQVWVDARGMDWDRYNTWLECESGMRYPLDGVVTDSEQYCGVAAPLRSGRQGPAGKREQKLFLRLLPHIRRAMRIAQQVNALRAERQSLIDTIHQARYGVLFLDDRGRVIFANRAAEALVAQQDGLSFDRNGHLRADTPTERSELARLIALATGTRTEEHAGGTLAASRPSGKRPYALTITSFQTAALESILGPRAVAAIFITDPEAERVPSEAIFRHAYGLTPAESRLALALLNADSLKEAASRLGLTEGSARQTLKRIFSKTDCHSQAALVRLLLSLSEH